MMFANHYQVMIYKEYQDFIETLIKESGLGREILNGCWEMFTARIIIEENYAKQLSELANNLGRFNYSINLQPILNIFKREMNLRAEMANNFAKSIKDQIVQQLKEVVTNQNKNVKPLFDDGRNLKKQLNQKKIDLDKMTTQLSLKQSDYNQHQIIYWSQQCISDISTQKRSDNTYKNDKMFRNIYELQQKLKIFIQQYNSFLEGYELRMTKIIQDLKEQEQSRFQILRQILVDYLNYPENIATYNSNLIQEALDFPCNINLYEQLQPDFIPLQPTIIQSFIQESIKKIEFQWNYVLQTYFEQSNNLQQNTQIIGQQDIDRNQIVKPLKNSKDELKDYLIHHKNQEIFQSILTLIDIIDQDMQKIWNGEQIDIDGFVELLIENEIGRYVWMQELQKFRIKQKFQLSELAYENVVNLLNKVLIICNNEFDAYITRKLIHMSLTFFKIDQNRVFLFHGILENQIFKSLDLWDAIYFESLYEEMKKQENMKSNEEIVDSILREKNTIFGFLASLVQNMLTFGQDKQQVKTLLMKYCKIYILPEQQLKSLITIIEGMDQKSPLLI